MAIAASSPAAGVGLGHTLLSPARFAVQAVEWIRECNRMAREFDRLSHKTDTRLAAAGLTREDIPAHIRKASGLF
ncbi:MAG: hypothetical protein CML66_29210 [Rhodobacteraceae bacterium]|nr:hypothetical protein [Paracoccaceae bacterium]MAY44414.1 hypothetical protein [Paracoccaceae bacterium]QEW23318.1 hypothetical protein LA6_005555 [Paracoccaceae bacterium]